MDCSTRFAIWDYFSYRCEYAAEQRLITSKYFQENVFDAGCPYDGEFSRLRSHVFDRNASSDPNRFVAQTVSVRAETPFGFGTILAAFVLVYALAFLPVSILFTVKRFNPNPCALVLAASLIDLSFLIEIINNLPSIAIGIYPGQLASISPDTLLYLRQVEMLRFLSFDVAGFTLAYVAIFIYAIVYLRLQRWLSYTSLASIVLFIANVPCLWFAPNAAVILIVMSIFAYAPVPILLARMAIE